MNTNTKKEVIVLLRAIFSEALNKMSCNEIIDILHCANTEKLNRARKAFAALPKNVREEFLRDMN